MTAPAPPPEQDSSTEELAIAALAAWLASSLAIHAAQLPGELVAQLVRLGLSRKAILAAGRMALSVPVPGATARRRIDAYVPGFGGVSTRSAADQMADREPGLRARYIVNAARRLTVSLNGGVPGSTAFRVERRNLDASVHAARTRAAAARMADEAARISPWLEWRCKTDASGMPDERVTSDCRRMHGRVFTLDNPPKIGLPGAVHPTCRCRPRPYGVSQFEALPIIYAVPTGVI